MNMKMSIAVVLLALAGPALCGCGGDGKSDGTPPRKTDTKAESVTFTTPDDAHVIISANFYKAAVEKAPAVILIHQRGSNKEEWGPIIDKIVARGYNVLAFDVRGHGGSTKTEDGKTLNYEDFKSDAGADGPHWWQCKYDVAAAHKWLEGKGIDKFAIIGASVGCSIGARFASESNDVKGVIMLSPVLTIDPSVVQALSAMADLKEKAFMYYCKDDGRGSNEAAIAEFQKQLKRVSPVVHMFDGNDHGMAMLGKKYGDVDVDENILKELDSTLK
jgi:pimeloyl-ACP methyl ester carboxylesterase